MKKWRAMPNAGPSSGNHSWRLAGFDYTKDTWFKLTVINYDGTVNMRDFHFLR